METTRDDLPQKDNRKLKNSRPHQGGHKVLDEEKNPCIKEHLMSLKCMTSNIKLCEPYFTNYTECQRFWDKVRSDRKWSGVKPHLPPPEEREEIKRQYQNR